MPRSPHEPAGGIFGIVGTTATVDRADETRVEMSLVELGSPGPQGSPDDDGPRARDTFAPRLAVAPALPPVDDEDRIGLARIVGSTAASPGPLAVGAAPRPSGELTWERPGVPESAAAEVRRVVALGQSPRPVSWRGPGRTLLLGLGGSAILGVGLHATAVRRAGPPPLPPTARRHRSPLGSSRRR